MTGVEYVREICRQKGITIRKLELDLGFSNGYLNPKKTKKIPYDKAKQISDYLHVDINPVLGLPENTYYLDPDVAQMAQEIHDNEDLKILFDATRDATKEDLQIVIDIAKRLFRTE